MCDNRCHLFYIYNIYIKLSNFINYIKFKNSSNNEVKNEINILINSIY